MYITDWMSTLLHVAGLGTSLPGNLDSLNMWPAISIGKRSPRKEIVQSCSRNCYESENRNSCARFSSPQTSLKEYTDNSNACGSQSYKRRSPFAKTARNLERHPKWKESSGVS